VHVVIDLSVIGCTVGCAIAPMANASGPRKASVGLRTRMSLVKLWIILPPRHSHNRLANVDELALLLGLLFDPTTFPYFIKVT
jgi:hypothetical protein